MLRRLRRWLFVEPHNPRIPRNPPPRPRAKTVDPRVWSAPSHVRVIPPEPTEPEPTEPEPTEPERIEAMELRRACRELLLPSDPSERNGWVRPIQVASPHSSGIFEVPTYAAAQALVEQGWVFVPAVPRQDVERAAELLRSAGWRVEPPPA